MKMPNTNSLRPRVSKPMAETGAITSKQPDIDRVWFTREYMEPIKNAKRLCDYRLCRDHGWNTRPFGW